MEEMPFELRQMVVGYLHGRDLKSVSKTAFRFQVHASKRLSELRTARRTWEIIERRSNEPGFVKLYSQGVKEFKALITAIERDTTILDCPTAIDLTQGLWNWGGPSQNQHNDWVTFIYLHLQPLLISLFPNEIEAIAESMHHAAIGNTIAPMDDINPFLVHMFHQLEELTLPFHLVLRPLWQKLLEPTLQRTGRGLTISSAWSCLRKLVIIKSGLIEVSEPWINTQILTLPLLECLELDEVNVYESKNHHWRGNGTAFALGLQRLIVYDAVITPRALRYICPYSKGLSEICYSPPNGTKLPRFLEELQSFTGITNLTIKEINVHKSIKKEDKPHYSREQKKSLTSFMSLRDLEFELVWLPQTAKGLLSLATILPKSLVSLKLVDHYHYTEKEVYDMIFDGFAHSSLPNLRSIEFVYFRDVRCNQKQLLQAALHKAKLCCSSCAQELEMTSFFPFRTREGITINARYDGLDDQNWHVTAVEDMYVMP